MSKTFTEVLEEIKATVVPNEKGRISKTFNRSLWNKLALAFVNTPEYKAQYVSVKGDEVTDVDSMPVEALRKMFYQVLVDFGVDKQEAEKVLTSYKFRNADALYEVASELIYQYCAAGKKFDFPQRRDFVGSITISDVAQTISKHKNPHDGSEIEIEKAAHRVLKTKSKTPKWLKKRL